MHSITTLARLSGVKQETIRTWERRYAVVAPSRDDRGRRVYTDADVRRLRLVAELVRAGHAIGDIAHWSDERCDNVLRETASAAPAQMRSTELREALLQAVASDDMARFDFLLGTALTSLAPLAAAEEVIAPALVKIGELWRTGEIGIDQEHAFSVAVRRQLTLAIAYLGASANGPGVVFSTLSDEHHELGALMACYVATAERVKCHYLGPNTPAADLASAAARLNADAIALSLVLINDAARAEDELRTLAERKPARTKIILGVGAAAKNVVETLDMPASILRVDSLDAFLRLLRPNGPGA